MYAAALLANFFEAGWAVQVLIGDLDRQQYFASRLTRREIERQLHIMADSARALPLPLRAELPRVDWQAYAELADALPCQTEAQCERVWECISEWLPLTGHHLNIYRRQRPELFSFKFD